LADKTKVALEFWDEGKKVEEITFTELDLASNRAANWLIAEGMTAGQKVALVAENSIPFLIWLLGFIKVPFLDSLQRLVLTSAQTIVRSHCRFD